MFVCLCVCVCVCVCTCACDCVCVYIVGYLLVVEGLVQGQGLILHRRSPASTAYQTVHSSPNFSKSPYRLTSTHQYYDLSPIIINKIF